MIKGKYRITYGDVVIEKENVITNNGILMMNKFLTGNAIDWAGSIALGVLSKNTPSATQTSLDYEVARYPVTLKSFKQISSGSNQIILKTTIDPSVSISIYELGVFPINIIQSSQKDQVVFSNFSESISASSSAWRNASGYISGANYITASTAIYPASRFGTANILLQSGSTAYITQSFDITNYNSKDSLNLLYYTSSSIASQSATVSFADTNNLVWSNSGSITSAASGWNTLSITLSGSKPAKFNGYVSSASIALGSGSNVLALETLKFVSGESKTPEYLMTSRTTFTYNSTSYSQSGNTITFRVPSTTGMSAGNLVTVSGASAASGSSVNSTYLIKAISSASAFTVTSPLSQTASGTGGVLSMGIVKSSGQPMDIEYYIQVT